MEALFDSEAAGLGCTARPCATRIDGACAGRRREMRNEANLGKRSSGNGVPSARRIARGRNARSILNCKWLKSGEIKRFDGNSKEKARPGERPGFDFTPSIRF